MTECSVCFESSDDLYTLQKCGCVFCKRCVHSYLQVRIISGDVLDIPCLSASCKQSFTHEEVRQLLASSDLLERYIRYKGNRDVERDPNRTFCPNPLCSCICDVPQQQSSEQTTNLDASTVAVNLATPRAVLCQQCGFLFCSLCHAPWNGGDMNNNQVNNNQIDSPQSHHPFRVTTAAAASIPMGNIFNFNPAADSTATNTQQQQQQHQCEVTYVVNRQRWNLLSRIGIDVAADDVMIKRCPCCGIPVERGPGCAQMLCLNCHHTFCWYCLTVLDGDVFLRHYESGVCRARLGHTPGDLRRHRARVAMALTCCGVVAVLLLPVIIVCSPCILTCVCCVRSLMNNSARGAANGAALPRAVSTPRHFSHFDGAAVTTTTQNQQQQPTEKTRTLSSSNSENVNPNNSPV